MIKVLLADDHKMVRQGLSYLLEISGDIQIIATASNGKEAVDCVMLNCPDVAVIDISMPVMDGIEATSHICKYCPDIQVVMLSMYDTPQYIHRALRAGAAGYILKDAAGDELVEAVRTLYEGNSYFSSRIEEIARNFK